MMTEKWTVLENKDARKVGSIKQRKVAPDNTMSYFLILKKHLFEIYIKLISRQEETSYVGPPYNYIIYITLEWACSFLAR